MGSEANKIEVLTFLGYYLPGYRAGGPVRTLVNMVEALADKVSFHIVTSDRDFGATAPYDGVETLRWLRVGKAHVCYVHKKDQHLFNWFQIIRKTPHDVLYLNSLFDPRFSILPLFTVNALHATKKTVVLAPRGELSPGAVALKNWKKRPFLWITRHLPLYRHVIWQASSADEARLIKTHYGASAQVILAPNLGGHVSDPVIPWDNTNSDRPLKVVFLSRIARKKNLDFALDALALVSSKIEFNIFGILEDIHYWDLCSKKMQTLPKNVEVQYRGELVHSDVPDVLRHYDLLLFPTRGENYGHVIAEALSAGVPVLISDQTPWKELEKEGVGWDLPLSIGPQGFARLIDQQGDIILNNRGEWRTRCVAYARRRLEDPAIVDANLELFRVAVAMNMKMQS